MIKDISQILLIFIIPYLIIRFKDIKLTKLFGTIGIAYFFGLVIAGIIFTLNEFDIIFHLNTDIGEIGSYAAISIGIPLLLFGSNLQEAKKLSKMVLKSFIALIFSVIIVASIAFYIYGKSIHDGAALSAAAIGLYTGGTPNLNAIANYFRLPQELIALANLSDIIIGAIFYMFLLFLAKPILRKILGESEEHQYLKSASDIKNTENFNFRDFKTSKRLFKTFMIALIMTVLSAGSGLIIWIALGSVEGRMLDFIVPMMLIGVTLFGIAGSFNKKIRETEGTNILGHYLILVFSFSLASSVDFSKLIGSDFVSLIILYGIITVGSFIVHVIFAKILKIDADCMIVTATGGIYGPAFVPAITKQLKNDDLTVPGLIVGSVGYALGTFLGIIIGYVFLIGM